MAITSGTLKDGLAFVLDFCVITFGLTFTGLGKGFSGSGSGSMTWGRTGGARLTSIVVGNANELLSN